MTSRFFPIDTRCANIGSNLAISASLSET